MRPLTAAEAVRVATLLSLVPSSKTKAGAR
jgi:hypothetical protein